MNQAVNIYKSNKGVTKEIEHISNNNTNTLVSKFLTAVTETHKECKKTIHLKLKQITMQHNSIQKNNRKSLFSLDISLTQSPLTQPR